MYGQEQRAKEIQSIKGIQRGGIELHKKVVQSKFAG